VFDSGRHYRAKIGFVLLATEQTIEDDMYQLLPKGVGIHFTRAAIPDSITAETLTDLTNGLGPAAALLLPDGSLDVITYACTSGSLVVGEERVFHELAKGAPKAIKTTLITSVMRALNQIKAKRIVIATPYLDEINLLEKAYMASRGFEILAIQGLQLEKDSDMVNVTPDCILHFAQSLDRVDADAIFISCGALRSIDIIEELERRTGKPVITSNQAMAWDVMRLAGIDDAVEGFGTLLRDY
jgi:maleate isomerase